MLVPHPENPDQTIDVGVAEEHAIEVCPYKDRPWHKDKMCKSCLAISKKIKEIRMADAEQFARIVEAVTVPEKKIGFFDVLMNGSSSFSGEVVESTRTAILSALSKEFKL